MSVSPPATPVRTTLGRFRPGGQGPAPARLSGLAVALAGLAGLLGGVGSQALYVTVGPNFHTVVPGRCYRCGQPTPDQLREWVRAYGIRTVINLRGDNSTWPWYQQERALARELGVAHVDINMSSYYLISAAEFRKLVDALGDRDQPVLLHCRGGSDRAGFASAAFSLLWTDADVDRALGQFSLRFGHLPWGRASCQSRVFAAYARWLGDRGLVHAPESFRQWVSEVYREDGLL